MNRCRALGLTAAFAVFGDTSPHVREFQRLDDVRISEQLNRARTLLRALADEIRRRLTHGRPPPQTESSGPSININTLNAGAAQLGSHRTQNVASYGSVLQSLSHEIEKADVPPDEKKRLRDHLAAVLGSKVVQTILAAAATGAAAAAAKHFLE